MPAFQVMVLPIPTLIPLPMAPVAEVTGTLYVIPSSLEISSVTFTVGVSAATS